MGLGDITRLKQNDIILEKFRHRLMRGMSATLGEERGAQSGLTPNLTFKRAGSELGPPFPLQLPR